MDLLTLAEISTGEADEKKRHPQLARMSIGEAPRGGAGKASGGALL
ncbi:hypothetical protein SLNWT_7140 [Streptomyces albus]|uniref:Uncharacterized protein n=1 Tax=Streptomyces albus (strain ATCC 21838 / DSM 41398 / FERM P-419 / JCM 4703 / NBRC 107858) TaxID=1081613 RepID=A0A0B5F9K1_STRA4|nr:hypothetical protein SLNWT_7140 [Streptomyces albus]AOU81820.1 hypothetical protein SLNHY_7129 [Streptomyces albus]AYN37507.1 hypothetical protein DUI70_7014 [Streptomyces albus]